MKNGKREPVVKFCISLKPHLKRFLEQEAERLTRITGMPHGDSNVIQLLVKKDMDSKIAKRHGCQN